MKIKELAAKNAFFLFIILDLTSGGFKDYSKNIKNARYARGLLRWEVETEEQGGGKEVEANMNVSK